MSTLPTLFFLLVVIAIDVAAHVYLYRRLVLPLTDEPRLRRVGAVGCALLALLLAMGPAAVRLAPGALGTLLSRAGFLWMALGFYLLAVLLFADLLRLLGRGRRALAHAGPASPERRQVLARAAGLGALAVSVPTVAYGRWRAWAPPVVNDVEVALARLPPALSGLTIVQLTDIHVGPWIDRGFVEELARRAQVLEPDLFAITGDLVDGSVASLGEAVAPLGRLRSRFGTFFVNGNHEYYSGLEEWNAALARMGIRVLRNERVEIGEPGASFDLVGVDDWSARRLGNGYDLDAALAGRDPNRAAVLLAHQPGGFEDAARRGIGLQISGHTHGGQMFPWTLLVHAVYHRYTAGLARFGDAAIYVSRGCGFWGPPVRVGAPPELVRIRLVPAG
jgi:predicted MPP superfamily phosphohydrolase